MSWCWSSQQPWSSGIAKASGCTGGGDHAVRGDLKSPPSWPSFLHNHLTDIAGGDIIAFPEVGGLHHRYERRAA